MTENKSEIISFDDLLKLVREFSMELNPNINPSAVNLSSCIEDDLAIDSIARTELLARIEKRYRLTASEQMALGAKTVGELFEALKSKQSVDLHYIENRKSSLKSMGEGSVPVQAKTLTEVLLWHSDQRSDFPFITLYKEDQIEHVITYHDLLKGAQSVAVFFQNKGLVSGQSVALMLPTSREFFISFFGILIAGGVPVPIYPPHRLDQVEDHLLRQTAVLKNAQVRWLISFSEVALLTSLLKARVPVLEEIFTFSELSNKSSRSGEFPEVKEEDLALLQYTSGSTSTPKGVALTHANLLANLRAMGEVIETSPKDIFISWLPLYHDMGLIGAFLGSLYFGSKLIIMSPLSFIANPKRWLQAIHDHRGTLSAAPNFAYELCNSKIDPGSFEELDLSSWRLAFNGAEPVSSKTVRSFCRTFSPFGFKEEALCPVYGLAENSLGLAFPKLGQKVRIDRVKRKTLQISGRAETASQEEQDFLELVSCGSPIPGHEIRIIDSAGHELGEREEGRLQFRGPSASREYYRNPEATQNLLFGEWRNSGDYAYLAQGEVFITGRAKDIIIRAGRNIHPQELEQAVGELSGIRKGCVAVFPSRDPETAADRLIVLAETRLSSDSEKDELKERIRKLSQQLLGSHPDDVVIAAPRTVPKTSSGKLRRSAARELYESGKIKGKRPVWMQFFHLFAGGSFPLLVRYHRVFKSYLYAVYFGLCFGALSIPVYLVVLLVPSLKLRRLFVSWFASLFLKLTGVPCSVAGTENISEDGYIIVSNHASYLDGFILSAVLPPGFSFVAKKELLNNPFASLFLRRLGTQFVERFDRKESVEEVTRMGKTVEIGQPLVFFSEGTFFRSAGLRPFRMGGFQIAVKQKIPVVPVAIKGSREILRGTEFFPRYGSLQVTIGQPIFPEKDDFSEIVKLRNAARSFILKYCGERDLASEGAGGFFG